MRSVPISLCESNWKIEKVICFWIKAINIARTKLIAKAGLDGENLRN